LGFALIALDSKCVSCTASKSAEGVKPTDCKKSTRAVEFWICVSTRISLSGASACVLDFIERGFCTWNLKNLRKYFFSPEASTYSAEQMRMWMPTSLSSYRMMRSSVCCGAKLAMDASGVLESLSVSRVSCVCTSTLRPTLLSWIGAELQSEM